MLSVGVWGGRGLGQGWPYVISSSLVSDCLISSRLGQSSLVESRIGVISSSCRVSCRLGGGWMIHVWSGLFIDRCGLPHAVWPVSSVGLRCVAFCWIGFSGVGQQG